METSAKNATNVEQAFMAMAASIKNRFVLTGSKVPFFLCVRVHACVCVNGLI